MQHPQTYAGLRTVLIGGGVAALGFLSLHHAPQVAAPAAGSLLSAPGRVALGIALQVLLVVAGVLIRRRAPDPSSAARVLLLLELVGDGCTVLLFALGVFGSIRQALDSV
jgi:hypothetical protein